MMQIKCMCSTVKCLNKASRFASRDERHLWESYSVLKEKALKSFPPRKQLYFTFPVVYSFSVVLCSISFRAIRSGVMRSGGSKRNSWTCKVNSIKDLPLTAVLLVISTDKTLMLGTSALKQNDLCVILPQMKAHGLGGWWGVGDTGDIMALSTRQQSVTFSKPQTDTQ